MTTGVPVAVSAAVVLNDVQSVAPFTVAGIDPFAR
jgi:hypothetical protein